MILIETSAKNMLHVVNHLKINSCIMSNNTNLSVKHSFKFCSVKGQLWSLHINKFSWPVWSTVGDQLIKKIEKTLNIDTCNNLIYTKQYNVYHATNSYLSLFTTWQLEWTQDKISPFSRLNGDWMVAEWRLNGDGKGGFQSHFIYRSVIIRSTKWQAHFSDFSVSLFFLKIKLRSTRIAPGI